MEYSSYLDMNILKQCTPSILITLLGMIFGNQIIKDTLSNQKIHYLPFLLQCSCILSMKNSIEIAYAIGVSVISKERKNHMSLLSIKSILIIIQSLMIGFIIGIISIFYQLLINEHNKMIFVQVLYISITSCLLSTLVFVMSFLLAHWMMTYFNMSSENFAMPILNIINEIFVIKILSVMSLKSFEYDIKLMIFYIYVESCIMISFLIYFLNYESIQGLYLGDTWVLSIIVNIIAGFIVDNVSKDYPILAQTYHLYSNIASSITFIYSHKTFLAFKNNTDLSHSIILTLLLISVICSLFYIFVCVIFSLDIPFLFLIGFLIIITVQTGLIIKGTRKLFVNPNTRLFFGSSSFSVLISSFSDLASIFSIILISKIFY